MVQLESRKKVVMITILFISLILLTILFVICTPSETKKVLKGTFFVSDAGCSHGGFEYNAEWNATLSVSGKEGILTLELAIGLGDALKKHEYNITDFIMDSEKISMKIDGKETVLEFVKEDKIWNGQYNNHYIASWGSDAPSEEIIGKISPTTFPGLEPHFYVELRLKESP